VFVWLMDLGAQGLGWVAAQTRAHTFSLVCTHFAVHFDLVLQSVAQCLTGCSLETKEVGSSSTPPAMQAAGRMQAQCGPATTRAHALRSPRSFVRGGGRLQPSRAAAVEQQAAAPKTFMHGEGGWEGGCVGAPRPHILAHLGSLSQGQFVWLVGCGLLACG